MRVLQLYIERERARQSAFAILHGSHDRRTVFVSQTLATQSQSSALENGSRLSISPSGLPSPTSSSLSSRSLGFSSLIKLSSKPSTVFEILLIKKDFVMVCYVILACAYLGAYHLNRLKVTWALTREWALTMLTVKKATWALTRETTVVPPPST